MAISIGSDNLVTLSGLIDNTTALYQNSATVTGALLTATNTPVTTFNLTYVTSSNGNYRGTIPAATTATLTVGAEYKIKVTAVSVSNTLVLWQSDVAENTVG